MEYLPNIEFINDSDYFHSQVLTRKINSSGNFYNLITNPTANCQLFLVGYAHIIFDYTPKDKIMGEFVAASKESGSKPICLIDIDQKYCQQVKDVFKDDVILESPYISTNGSNMCIFLLRIRQNKLY